MQVFAAYSHVCKLATLSVAYPAVTAGKKVCISEVAEVA
jgi:hypothetical protein